MGVQQYTKVKFIIKYFEVTNTTSLHQFEKKTHGLVHHCAAEQETDFIEFCILFGKNCAHIYFFVLIMYSC